MMAVFFVEKRLEFTKTRKGVNLELSDGGHILINLDIVGEWTEEDSVYYVKK